MKLDARQTELEYLDAAWQMLVSPNGAGPPPLDVPLGDPVTRKIQGAMREVLSVGALPATISMLRTAIDGDEAALRLLGEIPNAGGVASKMQTYVAELVSIEHRRAVWRAADAAKAKVLEGDVEAAIAELRAVADVPTGQASKVTAVRDGDAVVGEARVQGLGLVTFEATKVHQERTGLHARIQILGGERVLAYSYLNCERDSDRTRLANSAGSHGREPRKLGQRIKVALDDFCLGMWEAWLRPMGATWVRGEAGLAPSFLLEPYLLAGGGTILFGPPCAGKSWIGLLWALALQEGRGRLWPVRRSRVLYCNLERPLDWRIHGAGKALGIESPSLHMLNRRGKSLADVHEVLVRDVRTHGIELVVLDSLSRAGAGDLTTNEAANRAMDMLNGLGVGWLCLAHAPRSTDSHTYGSIMFDAAADLCVRLTGAVVEPGAPLGIQLEVTKANDIARPAPQTWALVIRDGLLQEVRPAHAGEFPELQPVARSAVGVVRDHLAMVGKATVSDVAEAAGISEGTVRRVLNSSKQFVRIAGTGKGGRGNKALWGLKATHVTEQFEQFPE